MGSLLSHFLESVLPPSVRCAEIEERGRARVLVGFTLVLIGAAIFIIGIQTLREAWAGVAVGFVIGFVCAAILIAVRAGAPLHAAASR